MKKIKVDPNNLPTKEVIAINEAGHCDKGILTDDGIGGVLCANDNGIIWEVTHYIPIEDILNLPEE